MTKRTLAMLSSVAATCLASLGTATAAAAGPASPNAQGPPCGTSFDPYAYAPAGLAACGMTTYPLSSVTTMADGVRLYNYDEGNGVVAHYPFPPAGLNLANATDNQLAELYLSAPAGVSPITWRSDLSTMTIPSPPAFQAASPSSADTVHSTNWSGYADTGSAGAFDGAESDYREPSYNNNSCSNDQTAEWAGIGGYYGSDALGQVGTAHNATGLANHEGWYEVVPLETMQAIPNFVASANDAIQANVRWDGSQYYGFIYDVQTGKNVPWSQSVASTYYSGDSAEAIVERLRQGLSGPRYNLSNFGTAVIFNSYRLQGGTYHSLDTGTRHGIHMINGSHDLADPNTIGSGGAFNDIWAHCS